MSTVPLRPPDPDHDEELQAELHTAASIVTSARRLQRQHGTGAMVRAVRTAYAHLAQVMPACHDVPLPGILDDRR